MCIDSSHLYDDGLLFFQLNGNAVMRLSRTAAMSVCRLATDRSFHVLRVEGGIWHSPGFEARVDSIWDSKYGNLNNDIILIGIPDCFIIHDGIVDIIDWKTNDKINLVYEKYLYSRLILEKDYD